MDAGQITAIVTNLMNRRLVILLTIGAFLIATALYFQPIGTKLRYLIYMGALVVFTVGVVVLFWKQKPMRYVVFAGIGVLLLSFALPAASPNSSDSLRVDYVANLRELEGSPYVWGGENRRGIDCSGLPRYAYRTALRKGGQALAFLEHR